MDMKRRTPPGKDRAKEKVRRFDGVFRFNHLPTELQFRVFSYLRPKHLAACSLVSTHWASLSRDESLWRQLCALKARFVPWSDGMIRMPGEFDSWRKFYPLVKFQNQLKRLGADLVDHALLTCDHEWQIVSFCLERVGNGGNVLFPHYKLVVGPDASHKNAKGGKISEGDFKSALRILGIQPSLRASFFGQLFADFHEILQEHGINWQGHLVTLRHRESSDLGALVEVTFSNREQPEGQTIADINQWVDSEVYKMVLSPSFGIVNADLLKLVLQRAAGVDQHDRMLRALLAMKRFTSTDLESSILRLVNSQDDSTALEIPFQVIGSYSREYHTWCWSWYNESYTKEQCAVISAMKEKSAQNKWPECNLFATPVIDCEFTFAFAIAHLCISRMDKAQNTLVYPFTPVDDGPRIFLALQLPQDIVDTLTEKTK